jgi:hypothetical protein
MKIDSNRFQIERTIRCISEFLISGGLHIQNILRDCGGNQIRDTPLDHQKLTFQLGGVSKSNLHADTGEESNGVSRRTSWGDNTMRSGGEHSLCNFLQCCDRTLG